MSRPRECTNEHEIACILLLRFPPLFEIALKPKFRVKMQREKEGELWWRLCAGRIAFRASENAFAETKVWKILGSAHDESIATRSDFPKGQ